MSFQPALPISGLAGWQFLTRTRAAQQAGFDRQPQITRDVAYFQQTIGKITSAEQLVQDRRLLSVALGAFGLDADLNARAFIRKVLESNPLEEGSFASRLSDRRYRQMSEAFGFGQPGKPNTALSDFAPGIVRAYQDRQFEISVGQQRPDLRMALSFARDLGEAIARQNTDNGRWYALMGSPPLREVMQKALGLPQSFVALEIDRQLEDFRDRARQVFGTDDLRELARPDQAEQLVRKFLARSAVDTGAMSQRGQIALNLLQAARR